MPDGPGFGAPFRRRYVAARWPYAEAQTWRMAAHRASASSIRSTPSTESNWPAKDALAPSSSTADERTATSPYTPAVSRASRTAVVRRAGRGVSRRIRSAEAQSAAPPRDDTAPAAKRSKTQAGITIHGGTRAPASASRARFHALPPTCEAGRAALPSIIEWTQRWVVSGGPADSAGSVGSAGSVLVVQFTTSSIAA